MVMIASTLASGLASDPNVDNEAAAINGFATAWNTYFSTASAGLVPIIPALLTTCQQAMIASMTGLSQSNNGAQAISNGITAYWGSVAALGTTLFPTATAVTPPPTLSTIPGILTPIFLANTQGNLDATTCYQQIATALHTVNIAGGIAILLIASVPTPTPIL